MSAWVSSHSRERGAGYVFGQDLFFQAETKEIRRFDGRSVGHPQMEQEGPSAAPGIAFRDVQLDRQRRALQL